MLGIYRKKESRKPYEILASRPGWSRGINQWRGESGQGFEPSRDEVRRGVRWTGGGKVRLMDELIQLEVKDLSK
jgi:hypothetical protein